MTSELDTLMVNIRKYPGTYMSYESRSLDGETEFKVRVVWERKNPKELYRIEIVKLKTNNLVEFVMRLYKVHFIKNPNQVYWVSDCFDDDDNKQSSL